MAIKTPSGISTLLVTIFLLTAAAMCAAVAIWEEHWYSRIAFGMWAPVFLYCALFLDPVAKMRAFMAITLRYNPDDPDPHVRAKLRKKPPRPWRVSQSRRTRKYRTRHRL